MSTSLFTTSCLVNRCTRTAEYGRYCCGACAETMRRWLRDIEDHAATLDATPSRGGKNGRRIPGYGSRPPARLDVIAARDPRTVSHAIGPDDVDGDVRSILGTLTGLARWIAEEADDLRPTHTPTITSEATYLRGRIDWASTQPWIDELADDLRDLHHQVASLAGTTVSPVAPCPDCDGPLWPVGDDTTGVRCGHCGTAHDGLDLLRIGVRVVRRQAP
ncbi:hypothetical protein [Saccharopolyspora rosea]|uniref:hypothetical protein n=1 Tax=Saccharopolyspora rosea TaxID=524884 RepID=UPI0021D83277|nr:hypothetical protein [Saccharopolyspora rosea]